MLIPIEILPLRNEKKIYCPIESPQKINNEYDMKRSISAKAMDKLIEYGWPAM